MVRSLPLPLSKFCYFGTFDENDGRGAWCAVCAVCAVSHRGLVSTLHSVTLTEMLLNVCDSSCRRLSSSFQIRSRG